VSLSDYWAKGMKTLHGLHSHGFPNCFHMGLTQTGLAPCFTYMLDGQSTHIAYIIDQAKKRGATVVEATPQAEAEWVATVHQPNFMSDYLRTCTPGYYNGEGHQERGEGLFDGQYGDGAVRFYELLGKWRAQGELAGLALR
jgi:hypothetical protein